MSNEEETKEQEIKSEVSKRLIDSMGPYSSDATINWLKDMSEDVMPDQNLLQQQNEEPPFMTMVCCLDTLFDHFQRYHWQYNKNQGNEELRISYTRPDFSKPVNDKIRCQGTLSTKKWTMLIEAEAEKILVYVIATESLSKFNNLRDQFVPLWQLNGKKSEFGILWRSGEDVICFDHLSFIAKKLFARITRVSKGESSTLEPFKIELPKQSNNNDLGQVLNRIRFVAKENNSEEFLQNALDRTTNTLTSLQVMCQQDLQEMTKMGIMALRSGDTDLNQKLTEHTKQLTELTNRLKPIIAFWHNCVK